MPRGIVTVSRWADANLEPLRPLLQDVMKAHAPGLESRGMDPRIEERWVTMACDPNTYVFVAWADNSPVGMAVVCEQAVDPWSERPAGVISMMHVMSSTRRRGVGNALLKSVVHLSEDVAWNDIVVHVPPNLRDSQRYFARLGFSPMVTRRVASVEGIRRKLGMEGTRTRISLPHVGRRAALMSRVGAV